MDILKKIKISNSIIILLGFILLYVGSYYILLRPIPNANSIIIKNGKIISITPRYKINNDFFTCIYYPIFQLDYSLRKSSWENSLEPFVKDFGDGEHSLLCFD